MITRRGLFGALAGTLLAPYFPALRFRRGSSLTIAQIVAVSYPTILGGMRNTANQWAESAFLRELEKQGTINRVRQQPVDIPLSYRRNE